MRMKPDAALQTSQPYFIGSMKIRRLLGITAFDATMNLARVWRRVGCDATKLPPVKAAERLRNQLKIRKQDSGFCHSIIELILGSTSVGGKVARCRETSPAAALESFDGDDHDAPSSYICTCFPVFVAWTWLFATASMDVLGLVAFRLFDDSERLGYVTTDGDVESILRFMAGNAPFEHFPDIVIRNRRWIRSSFSVDPVLNGGLPAVNEDRFCMLVERFEHAGYLHRLQAVQQKFRKMFGRRFWTPEKLDFARSQLKKPAFKERLLHVLATQCACLTASCEAAVSFADVSIMRKDNAGVDVLEHEASRSSSSSFALSHTLVNGNPLCCSVAPRLQYLLQLGGVPFEARVDGAGHNMSPRTRRHISFHLRCVVDSSRNVVSKYTLQGNDNDDSRPSLNSGQQSARRQPSPRQSSATVTSVAIAS
jgi:hypothetical protein